MLRIRDWVSFWLLDGSGKEENQHQDPGIWDEQTQSYFWELRNFFLPFFGGVKILKFFDEDQEYGMEIIRIRDPTSFHPGSELSTSRIRTISIPYPWSSSKNLSILTPPKKGKKKFLSSQKYDRVCSSQIPGSWCWFSSFPDPGVKKLFNPGSWIRKHCKKILVTKYYT
jgi:hypothetical protein